MRSFSTVGVIFMLFLSTGALAAIQWQADLKVLSVQATDAKGYWSCVADIQNSRDDAARDAKAIIQLPVGSNFIGGGSSVGICTANPLVHGSTNSHVICDLGTLAVNQTIALKLTATSSQTVKKAVFGFC